MRGVFLRKRRQRRSVGRSENQVNAENVAILTREPFGALGSAGTVAVVERLDLREVFRPAIGGLG